MKHANMGPGFKKQFVLLFFLFAMPVISKNSYTARSSPPTAFFYNYGVRTQLHEDALKVTYEEGNMVLNFKIKTISKIAISKVKYSGWDDKDGVDLGPLTRTTDPGYFNARTRLYTQYWSAKISLKSGDNIFTFTSYDKGWYDAKSKMEHESSIRTRNYTYAVLMREQAQYQEARLDRHMQKEMNDNGHYVKNCCIGDTDWYSVRKQMIQCAQNVSPSLAIPDDAKKEYAEGKAHMKGLSSAPMEDYYLPLSHLNKANMLAPWWGQVYYDLGMANEAAQNQEFAKENLELYLLFRPSGTQLGTAMKELHKINEILEAAKPHIKK